jgi:cytochrome c-type protein NapB
MKSRLYIIFCFILLMVGTILIFAIAITDQTDIQNNLISPVMSSQEENPETKRGYNTEVNYLVLPESKRSLSTYYDNRAFPGAPPSIPHPLLSKEVFGGESCLQCHEKGGFTLQFNAFAPVTPHPEWVSCMQCHIAKTSNNQFINTTWQKPTPPPLGTRALETAPNVIPHDLQNREHCLPCHAGPSAPTEIRVSHPDRVNCLQCHVTQETETFIASEETSIEK